MAISNSRIVKLENGQVTFRYRSARGRREQYCTLPAEEFIRRFLQHVLPRGFVKVRYYGLFSPAYRPVLHQLRLQLAPPLTEAALIETVAQLTAPVESPATPPCPHCGAADAAGADAQTDPGAVAAGGTGGQSNGNVIEWFRPARTSSPRQRCRVVRSRPKDGAKPTQPPLFARPAE